MLRRARRLVSVTQSPRSTGIAPTRTGIIAKQRRITRPVPQPLRIHLYPSGRRRGTRKAPVIPALLGRSFAFIRLHDRVLELSRQRRRVGVFERGEALVVAHVGGASTVEEDAYAFDLVPCRAAEGRFQR